MRRLAAASAILALLTSASPVALAVSPQAGSPPVQPDAAAQQPDAREQEESIEDFDANRRGITVGEPKVYDDALLQQMLRDAEAKLANLQVLDQSSITNKLGAITGASLEYSSLGVQVAGPGRPETTVATKSPTASTEESSKITSAPAGVTTEDFTKSTTAAGTRDETVKSAAVSPPTVSAPTPSSSMQGTFTVSSSDILNEQMQLTLEIANLRMLLEGSLSDVYVKSAATDGGSRLEAVKPRVTIGFPITVDPDRRYKKAVAVVEVEVTKVEDFGSGEPPAITALLPREKTYNVASITDRSTSIGGGMVTQIAGISGSFLRGRKTYYIVKDQDTLALNQPSKDPQRAVAFQWQFRPVLGQDYVRPGLKQTFAQIALPSSWSAATLGKVTVRSYWRRYDKKHGILGDVIPGSLRRQVVDWPIPRFRLVSRPKQIYYEDAGGGQVFVWLYGRFIGGTRVRVGANFPQLETTHFGLRFMAAADDLMTKNVALVTRDGMEMPILFPHFEATGAKKGFKKAPAIAATVTASDDGNSLVQVRFATKDFDAGPPPLILIGGRTFGLSNAPVRRAVVDKETVLTATVPTALLVGSPEIVVKPLFAGPDYETSLTVEPSAYGTGGPVGNIPYASKTQVDGLDTYSQNYRLVLLEQGKDSAKFLLYGNRLGSADVIHPAGAEARPLRTLRGETAGSGFPADPMDETLRVLSLTAEQVRANKNLVLQRPGERPVLVAIPTVEFKDAAPAAKPVERVTVHVDTSPR